MDPTLTLQALAKCSPCAAVGGSGHRDAGWGSSRARGRRLGTTTVRASFRGPVDQDQDQDQEETGIFAGWCTLVSFAILGGCGCGFCFFLVA